MDALATVIEFASLNHFRALDWQLQLARQIVEHDLPQPRHRDHPALGVAVLFLRADARCRSDRDRARLQERLPALLEARRLAEEDAPLAWEVRARVLAGQTDDEIAGRCGVSPDTIHLYEALHFNVRDRLDAPDWVASRVIGPGLWRGFTGEEMGKLWMAVGFYGGPLALDAVIEATLENGVVSLPKPGGRRCSSSARDILRQKVLLAVGALTLPADAPLGKLGLLNCNTRRSKTSPKRANATQSIIADLTPDSARLDPATRKRRKRGRAAMARPPKNR